jgi:hypothetical protein
MTKPAPKQDHKPDNPAQYQRFIELAKELGAEEGEDIDAAVRRLASQKPEPRRKVGKAAKKESPPPRRLG